VSTESISCQTDLTVNPADNNICLNNRSMTSTTDNNQMYNPYVETTSAYLNIFSKALGTFPETIKHAGNLQKK